MDGSTVSTSEQRVSSFAVNQSSYGLPLPIVFGTARISGIMLDYDDFTAIAHTTTTHSGGKLGGGVTSSDTKYTYTVAAAIALCEGKCSNVGGVWAGKSINKPYNTQVSIPWHNNTIIDVTADSPSPGNYKLTESVTVCSSGGDPVTAREGIDYIDHRNGIFTMLEGNYAFMGVHYETNEQFSSGGISKMDLSFFDGSIGQSPWGYMASKHPEKAIGYSGISYVAGVIDLGTSASLPNCNFEIYGLCQNQNPTPTSNLTYQYAYHKEIDVSNYSSNIGVKEYTYGQGWIPIDGKFYTITQKKDSCDNNIPGVFTYTFNFDDRSDGCDRVDPLSIRINYNATAGSVQYTPKDANPRDIIYELMTNQVYGAQFPIAYIDDWSDYSNYCIANSLLLSEAITSQQQTSEIITNILEATNSDSVWSQGKAKIVPYYDNLAPVYDITENNILGQEDNSIVITRNSQADSYNVVPVEFTDRANDYNGDTVYATDQGDIDLHGIRQASTKSHNHIMNKSVAQTVAQTILQRQLYIRNKHVVKLGQEFILLDPMDATTLACNMIGLDETSVRVVSIKESKEDYSLEFTFEDNPTGVMSAPLYDVQNSTRTVVDSNVNPGSVNTPIIFDPPAQLTGGNLMSWIAVSGQSKNWGGCNVWVSQDGNTYKKVGQITAPAPTGNLSAALASGVSPDTTNTLSVDLIESMGRLSSGTQTDATNYNTICYVDGELIAYQTATLTATSKYNLTYLVRGIYGTTISAHAINSQFARLNDAVFKYDFDTINIGQTIYVKLTSFNVFSQNEQTLDEVVAYSHTLTNAGRGNSISIYHFTQSTAAAIWTINHNLNNKPAVNCVDASGNSIVGTVSYTSLNSLTITFSVALAGSAYLT